MKKQFPVLLFILLASVKVSADTEGVIQPYTLETADKKYIFVMLSGLLIWPLIFWFGVFTLASFLNFLLVKATRLMRFRHLTEQADNAAL